MDIIVIYNKNNVHYYLNVQQVIGKMEIDLAFKRLLFPTQFVLVSNLAGPALLATDFLSNYRVQLDFFNKEIVIYKNIKIKSLSLLSRRVIF